MSLLAALDAARGIGRGNAMPWHLPDDLKRFKALTLGKPILMGGNTARSLGRALPGRRNLVLTRAANPPFEGMETVSSLRDALALADGETLMVIGGGEIYSMALPLATRLYLTHVATVVEDADVHFPDFDLREWRVDRREAHPADARHAFGFEFIDYSRIAGEAG
ncbi:MAG: diacylglycerol kinase [Gammaproteobacteria bacterium RIFCSPHIGHO2_12_FULL_63_22]|nr:MAG: diacylglycerol kinase [Gammaproteobacteria bacterium RIFCSPHIGHO2_12_FULL_63_22]